MIKTVFKNLYNGGAKLTGVINPALVRDEKRLESSEARPKSSDSSPSRITKSKADLVLEDLLGLLRVRVVRGLNLAVRDVLSSDPYVVIKLPKQKLKTRVIKRNLNPEWNEELTLPISDPDVPIKLAVYDYDTFSKDDKMGSAEFSIKEYIEALRRKASGLPSGTVIEMIQPSEHNCLAQASAIMLVGGQIVQDMCLRLQNVECGEVDIQLQWIDLPGCKGLARPVN